MLKTQICVTRPQCVKSQFHSIFTSRIGEILEAAEVRRCNADRSVVTSRLLHNGRDHCNLAQVSSTTRTILVWQIYYRYCNSESDDKLQSTNTIQALLCAAVGIDSHCDTVLSGRRVQALRGTYCLHSEGQSGLGQKYNIIRIYTTLAHAQWTHFRPEDGGSRFVQNVGTHLPVHTVS